jgi:predicted transcriptional regulator
MANSKKRGGAKAHRKRVEQNNLEKKRMRDAMQKLMDESIKHQIEEMKKKYEEENASGKTETSGI